MQAIRQSCRPKHQVLILKCYPQLQKGYRDAEIKPNSSELSYLLYYASTRRTKLVKVGDFLEKRTGGDVWRSRIGNVLVTLQILNALIEKCPRDIPLYANSVLSILRTVLQSNDITLAEASVPTFESFCAHQDPATLAADQEYITQYEEIVQMYAAFASKEKLQETKASLGWPVAIRFRSVGLQAIKAVAASESLSSETGRQLAVIIPVILVNLYANSGANLEQLERRETEKEGQDKEAAYKRRQSTSTLRPTETSEADPQVAAGTTEDADKLAEEEAGILAMQALRNIFTAVSREQLRLATSAVLKFMAARVKPSEHFPGDKADGSWPTTLFGMICGWATVQDRYTILVTAKDTLVRSKISEDELERQYVLATIIGWLLGAKTNFIGLSVMDVLIGLMGHILALLQVGSGASLLNGDGPKDSVADAPVHDRATTPSEARIKLLQRLQSCIANLATHIYYTDQIPDMLSAVLVRLKPAPSSGIINTAAAIEDPNGAVDAVADSAKLHDNPGADAFFSFETARVVALDAIKAILLVANQQQEGEKSQGGGVGRTRAGVDVWEGTQWLLRDPAPKVRRAYAEAVLTWLDVELQRTHLRVAVDTSDKREKDGRDSLARRAVSNASQREKSPRGLKTSFLPLLHLAVYENAHQFADSPDADLEFLHLHLLLARLLQNLGVNAAASGLPMIFRLQEDIPNPSVSSPAAKIRLATLAHGYFWTLAATFDFEASPIGQSIHNEITRRRGLGMWLEGIAYPPLDLSQIDNKAGVHDLAQGIVDEESIDPLDERAELVDRIAEGYSEKLYSPPTSPPTSPGRGSLSVTSPILGSPISDRRGSSAAFPQVLPPRVKEQLLEPWSREQCLAATAAQDGSSQSGSMSGSRAGTRTAATSQRAIAPSSAMAGPGSSSPNLAAPGSPSTHQHTHRAALGALNDPNTAGGPAPHDSSRMSASSARSAVRLDDLKKVLAGQKDDAPLPGTRMGRPEDAADGDDADDSDSLVSADFSASEYSFAPPGSSYSHSYAGGAGGENADGTRPVLETIPSEGLNTPAPAPNGTEPPVPEIPAQFAGSTATPQLQLNFKTPPPPVPPSPSGNGSPRPRTSATTAEGGRKNSLGVQSARSRSLKGARSGRSRSRSNAAGTMRGRQDLGGLLAGIDTDSGEEERERGRGLGVGAPY
ncbi:uncharacterized protein K452DRAFT_253927 [Aplosporella prunicola CBS 121167]|uniref:Protein EFR3 n=1 Tax=Aplosporella prunicola CBS 121167 TaxID=1176127 RepID=A0A6A6B9B8_9PEZI|nr:uncharacterized protein K452DRAFT_253927 [Aplosporella prunicola CBS 121167]KAF2139507.1 hypothetical protein K452DRAFT_253927 [Aplosporella prunicola CBS 121167]